jgi:cell division protein FtsQ
MGKATKREKQSKKISKKRAQRQRRQEAVRRFAVASVGGVLVFGGLGAWWAISSGQVAAWKQGTIDGLWNLTADAGFTLENVYLSGHKRVSQQEVMARLDVEPKEPILAVSLEEMREKLEEIPWVQSAQLSRSLPHDLHVHITERKPLAIWQYHGSLRLIDVEGVVLDQVSIDQYRNLPLVVGEGAPQHTAELFSLMAQDVELLRQVESAVRVGNRRWDIIFKQGLKLKLPENGADKAWLKFAELSERQSLLSRNISSIDLRLPDRYFIDLPEPETDKEGAQNT